MDGTFQFGSLEIGDRFEHEGHRYRKVGQYMAESLETGERVRFYGAEEVAILPD
jgi:hypothetical protein